MRKILLAALLGLVGSACVLAAGTVKVTGPPGTSVYVDGLYMGDVPLVLEDLRPGQHQLRMVSPSGEQRSQVVQVPAVVESYQEVDVLRARVDLDPLMLPPYWNAPYFVPQPFRYDPWYRPPLGYPPFRMHHRNREQRPPPPTPPHRPHPGGRGRHRGHR